MILITTTHNDTDNLDYVSSIAIMPKVMGPKSNVGVNQHIFTDKDIPSDFYRNYQKYYVSDGMLHYNPDATA